jgi:hypothetical protein
MSTWIDCTLGKCGQKCLEWRGILKINLLTLTFSASCWKCFNQGRGKGDCIDLSSWKYSWNFQFECMTLSPKCEVTFNYLRSKMYLILIWKRRMFLWRDDIFFKGSSIPFMALAHFPGSVIIYTDGRAPWTSDQPVARLLPKHRTTQTQKKRTQRHQCLERDSNSMIAASEMGYCDRLVSDEYTWHTFRCLPSILRLVLIFLSR